MRKLSLSRKHFRKQIMASTPYGVEVLPTAIKEMKRFPHAVIVRIREHLVDLGRDPFPRGSEKLHGYDRHYRIRVGDYRIVYTVDTVIRIVRVVKIADRKNAYKKF